MTLPTVIGPTGRAGAGKDSVAHYLCRNHGYLRMSLADPIKELLNTRFGWTMEDWEDRVWKERPSVLAGDPEKENIRHISPRQLAQWLGTEVGRAIGGEDVWVSHLVDQWNSLLFRSGRLVIPDIRFLNEAQYLFNHFPQGKVRIFEVIRNTDLKPVSPHISEAGIPRAYIHDTIVNNSGFEELYAEIEAVLK